ncbi:MAG: hypothetical protein HUU38_13710 [Anaerolineales bacterium]|nr:hypothetical protein [Anaerolineales bacterium]
MKPEDFRKLLIPPGTQYKNHWEATDPTTLAFGIQTPIAIDETPLSLDIWQPHCILLDYFATLLTEDPPSEIARLLIARRKNSPNS